MRKNAVNLIAGREAIRIVEHSRDVGGGGVVFGGWVLVFVLMRRLKWAKDKSMQSSESPEFCPIHCNKTASADLGRTIL